MNEVLLKAWEFLDGRICTGGKATHFDADHMLRLFPEVGPHLTIHVEGDQVMYLDTGDALDVTLWWRQSTGLFYLGVVGDDEGSITQ